jgi:hypothetical protein
MQHFIFVLGPVMHHTPLLFMPVLQEIRGLTPLHLFRVHHLLAVVIMIHSSSGHSRAFSACAKLQLKKLMKTAVTLLRSRVT